MIKIYTIGFDIPTSSKLSLKIPKQIKLINLNKYQNPKKKKNYIYFLKKIIHSMGY